MGKLLFCGLCFEKNSRSHGNCCARAMASETIQERLVPTLSRGNALLPTLLRRAGWGTRASDAGASQAVRSHAGAWERAGDYFPCNYAKDSFFRFFYWISSAPVAYNYF